MRREKRHEKALDSDNYLEGLIGNISPKRKKHSDREKGSTILITISKKHPQKLYGKWHIFTEYLRGNNAFSKYLYTFEPNKKI